MSFGRNKPFLIGNARFVEINSRRILAMCNGVRQSAASLAKIKVEKERETTRLKREKEDKARIKAVKERLKVVVNGLKFAEGFNQFIRLRDKDLPCISCGRYHQEQWHAGHYRSVGACPELRFDEMNVHKQCSVCNNYKSGNLTEYRLNLIRKIGEKKLNAWIEKIIRRKTLS